MPAESESQRKAAGAALGVKRGSSVKSLRGASKDMHESMTEDELEDFASKSISSLEKQPKAGGAWAGDVARPTGDAVQRRRTERITAGQAPGPPPPYQGVDMDKNNEDPLIKAIDSYFVKYYGGYDDVDSGYTSGSITGGNSSTSSGSNAASTVVTTGSDSWGGEDDFDDATLTVTEQAAGVDAALQGASADIGLEDNNTGGNIQTVQQIQQVDTALDTASTYEPVDTGTGQQPDQGVLVTDDSGVATDDQIGADLVTDASGVVTDDQITVIPPSTNTVTTGTGTVTTGTGTDTSFTPIDQGGTYTGTHDVNLPPVAVSPPELTPADFASPDPETTSSAQSACAD